MRRKPRSSYHHGDLREAICTVASAIVAQSGASRLTVRSVAERLGVSHPAIYHHFADRNAILAAVAQRGFEQLTAQIDRAMAAEQGALMRYRAQGLCYVTFAVAHPHVYAVMFGGELVPRTAHRELSAAADQLLERIRDAVRACQQEGLLEQGAPDESALFCWSAVHGLASLALERQLDKLALPDKSIDALAEMVVHRIFTGLGKRD